MLSDEQRIIAEKIFGKEALNLLIGPKLPPNYEQLIGIVVTDHLTRKTLLANLNFDEDIDLDDIFYSDFLTKVILKRVRVCYPNMQITKPSVVLIMLLSGSIGQAVENLQALVSDAVAFGDTTISALNCKCWETWPEVRD